METIKYRTKRGDTITGLANRFNTSPHDIARLNRLTFPESLLLNRILIIPVNSSFPSRWYIVRPGDSIYTIASLFGISVPWLVSHNNINYPYNLLPGQTLRIR